MLTGFLTAFGLTGARGQMLTGFLTAFGMTEMRGQLSMRVRCVIISS